MGAGTETDVEVKHWVQTGAGAVSWVQMGPLVSL